MCRLDQELVNALRLIIKEEITEQLSPIKEQLKDLGPMKEQLKDLAPMKEQLKDLGPMKEQLKDLAPMKEQLKDLGPIKTQLAQMQQQLDRMENAQTHDVMALLAIINGKLEQTATKEDITYLARKIGEHDLELDRLKRII
jgi:hypothetical protein